MTRFQSKQPEVYCRSLLPQLRDPSAPSAKPAHGFWTSGQRTVRTERWRLIVQSRRDGGTPRVELFDYQDDPGETRNHAGERTDIVREMLARLERVPQPASAVAQPETGQPKQPADAP